MKWGLIARSETDRGLGIQSHGIYTHLKPDRTLVVIDQKSGFRAHQENYPGAPQVMLKHGGTCNTLDEATVRDWWAGLDVVFGIETLYDWRLVEWARADGVATVLQGNPEFWMSSNPQPDVWTWPTTWRLQHLPQGPVIPVPCTLRPNTAADLNSPNLKALHIAGNRAMGDRNGLDLVAAAMRRIPVAVKLTLYSQAPAPQIRGVFHKAPVEDRWAMYKNQHVLILPRRYGGLCLPAIEAMSCGLAVAMPACSPNLDWPVVPIDGDTGRTWKMQTGEVETFDAYVNDVANTLKHLSSDRSALRVAHERARTWAEDNTWSRWALTYYDLLEDAARSRR